MSTKTATAPAIFSVYDAESDEHVIMCHSYARTEPFGPRIFRAPPHPVVRTKHATAESAANDVIKINAYFVDLPKRRKAVYREMVYSGNGLGGIDDCPLFQP
jgi:hypothetical protein